MFSQIIDVNQSIILILKIYNCSYYDFHNADSYILLDLDFLFLNKIIVNPKLVF